MTPSMPGERSDVIDLWDNLPPLTKGVSVAGVILYIFTLLSGIGFSGSIPFYIFLFCLIWPIILIVWIVIIWIGFAIIISARLLIGKQITTKNVRAEFSDNLTRTVIFVPTVIGTMISVVEVFATDVFGKDVEDEDQ